MTMKEFSDHSHCLNCDVFSSLDFACVMIVLSMFLTTFVDMKDLSICCLNVIGTG